MSLWCVLVVFGNKLLKCILLLYMYVLGWIWIWGVVFMETLYKKLLHTSISSLNYGILRVSTVPWQNSYSGLVCKQSLFCSRIIETDAYIELLIVHAVFATSTFSHFEVFVRFNDLEQKSDCSQSSSGHILIQMDCLQLK